MMTSRTVPTSLGAPLTIGQSFQGRNNSLNLLRLVLAVAVVFSHAISLGGYGNELIFRKTTLGTVAVYGFFGISGYLIASSASRNNVGRYLWQRTLRIFPAFWVCLLVTAFFFGLIAWYRVHPDCGLSCYLHAKRGPLDYIARNSWLKLNQHPIAHTPRGIPYPNTWDGSLWTLFYEFLCYLVLAVLAATRLLRHRWTVAILAAAVWVAEIVITSVPSLNAKFNILINFDASVMLALLPVFLAGSLLYLYRDKIPDSGLIALGCLALIPISLAVPLGNNYPGLTLTSTNLFAPGLAYVMLWLGIHLPFPRVGSRNDYSYGIYIYAWPVSQLLALWGVYRWGYPAYVSLNVLMTVPFAVASWWLIEKPALRLKHLSLRTAEKQITPSEGPLRPTPVSATSPLGE